jgi:hypothetical protein
MLHVIVDVRIRLFVVNLIFCSGVRRKEIVRSVKKKMNVLKLLHSRKAGKIDQKKIEFRYLYCLTDYVVPKHL